MIALIPNAKEVAQRAWSFRLAILAAMFSAAEVALPFFAPFVPPTTMAFLALLTAAGAAWARLISQPEMHKEEPAP